MYFISKLAFQYKMEEVLEAWEVTLEEHKPRCFSYKPEGIHCVIFYVIEDSWDLYYQIINFLCHSFILSSCLNKLHTLRIMVSFNWWIHEKHRICSNFHVNYCLLFKYIAFILREYVCLMDILPFVIFSILPSTII